MARHTGLKTKISRYLGTNYGNGKWLHKIKTPERMAQPEKRKSSSGSMYRSFKEKQKSNTLTGIGKQFRNTFTEASRRKGVTGENLIKLLEARLDNTVYRLGIAPSRQAARQLVSHKHITVNGSVLNIPSYSLKPGDTIGLKEKHRKMLPLPETLRPKKSKI